MVPIRQPATAIHSTTLGSFLLFTARYTTIMMGAVYCNTVAVAALQYLMAAK